jgi:phosphatidylserine/phosphatidylglycerophosphate/cardiolipin synthase-like enzyme
MTAHSQRRVGQFTILLFTIAFASGLARADEIQVCFNPPLPQGCDATKAVVQALVSARQQVLVQAWGLISAPIAEALVETERRVQDVRVILDRSAARRGYPFLERAGVVVLIDAEHALAHSSVMIVDRQTVITGSFNFTRSAQERNAEDLVLIRSPAVAAQYVRNWNAHAAHSQPVRSEASKGHTHQVARADAEGEDRRDRAARLTVGQLALASTIRRRCARVRRWGKRTRLCEQALRHRKLWIWQEKRSQPDTLTQLRASI